MVARQQRISAPYHSPRGGGDHARGRNLSSPLSRVVERRTTVGEGYVAEAEGRQGRHREFLLLSGRQESEAQDCAVWLRREGRILSRCLGRFHHGPDGSDDLVQD